MSGEVLGHVAVVRGNIAGAAPLFCTSCGSDVSRETKPLTDDDLEAFDTASCALCDETFYDDA